MGRKLLSRLLLAGVLAGAVVALRNYLSRSEDTGEREVQITFDDGSTHTLDPKSPEAREFTDIARKVVEVGV